VLSSHGQHRGTIDRVRPVGVLTTCLAPCNVIVVLLHVLVFVLPVSHSIALRYDFAVYCILWSHSRLLPDFLI
jgi:hypothetical protein